jgi:dipeptidyl aminopeptidase/acylaminoacyl peptidase
MLHNRAKLVIGGKVTPRWLDQGSRFWYRLEKSNGHEFILVNPAKETREPAFDHKRLARSLATAAGQDVDAAALPFAGITPTDGAVEFDAFGAHWRCNLDTYACTKVPGYVYKNPLEIHSPDGRWAVSRRGYDLWLRNVASGEERPLTSDGVADRSYGSPADALSFGTLMRRCGLPSMPPIAAWSPDSRRVITHRTDQRGVRLAHLVESAPAGGGPPALHTYRYAFPGDETLTRAELVVFDAEAGTAIESKAQPMLMPLASPIMFRWLWWSADGSAVYYLEQSRDQRTLWLRQLDPRTGEVRTLVEEKGEPRVEPSQFAGVKPIVRVLSNGRDVLWYSQRDGWGHLYLYDAETGKLRRQLTSGEWAVQEIVHVDEQQRVVYFVASGLIAADPYRRQVCRVGLDGTGFARLGNDDLDHIVTVPENEAYYIDSASTTDTAPVITIRSWKADVIVELERADISSLRELGWKPPERFCAKAADGKTDIYGLIYLPPDFNPNQRYPVIDHSYPGPQLNRVQPCFGEQVPLYDTESIAALGFVVVVVDGRGTPGRSREFHDLSYGHLDKAGFLEDHVAALRQLAPTRPWMDLDRVGMFGYSGGGFATVRAMCTYPDFYKVGVSICGNHEQRYYQLSWGETYDGPLDQETYARSSNAEIAHRLQGKLLLVHGGMDDNVHPHQTLLVADRLIAANKDFDLLIVPGAEHLFVGYGHYVTRRTWDYFVRHLLDAQPPAGYQLREVPLNLEQLFGG